MSLVFQMSAQMAQLPQVHFSSIKLVFFDFFYPFFLSSWITSLPEGKVGEWTLLHTLAASVNETQESGAKAGARLSSSVSSSICRRCLDTAHLSLLWFLQEKIQMKKKNKAVDYDAPAEPPRGRLPAEPLERPPSSSPTESDPSPFTQHARRSDLLFRPADNSGGRMFSLRVLRPPALSVRLRRDGARRK